MTCDYCEQEIYENEPYIETPDDKALHKYCADTFITENKAQYGFVERVRDTDEFEKLRRTYRLMGMKLERD